MPGLWPARENARLEIGSQRGRNSQQIGVLGIYDLQGLSYGRIELLVADMGGSDNPPQEPMRAQPSITQPPGALKKAKEAIFVE